HAASGASARLAPPRRAPPPPTAPHGPRPPPTPVAAGRRPALAPRGSAMGPLEHKEEGNRLFGQREWRRAAEEYTKGLGGAGTELPGDQRGLLLSNRSQCMLNLEEPPRDWGKNARRRETCSYCCSLPLL
ncbi:unnamed protein product, partial [Prorocentrum cordatum]